MYLCLDMAKGNRYVFNNKTLSYEVKKRPRWWRLARLLLRMVGSIAMAVLYIWIYTFVLEQELPKTKLIKKENAQWRSKVEVMNARLDEYDRNLVALQHRDNDIYRSIFGMNEISADVRNAGFGGVNRYSHYDDVDPNGMLKRAAVRLDVLSKKTYVQSKSFDEISKVSRVAGEMASCVPAIAPMCPEKGCYRMSSPFGYRSDPFSGVQTKHNGVDFAMKSGTPLYVTGDGVVESVKFELLGYGNQVVVNHGFGYKTRYAHMSVITVAEGMKLKRGQCVGLSGNSGKSSGPHLHYEVIYKGAHVNPANYYDLSIAVDEYATMVQEISDISQMVTLHPSHQKKKKK